MLAKITAKNQLTLPKSVTNAVRAKLAELLRVLAYPKFRLTAEEQQELLADYPP